jgi:hypothetical protein
MTAIPLPTEGVQKETRPDKRSKWDKVFNQHTMAFISSSGIMIVRADLCLLFLFRLMEILRTLQLLVDMPICQQPFLQLLWLL